MGGCPICCDTLKSPAFCIPCGHVFCNSCIQRWQRHVPNRSAIQQHFGIAADVTCPQCRAVILSTQKIRWDDSEIPETEEEVEDPWEESNDINTILKSLHNIWLRSDAKRVFSNAQNKLLSHDTVRNVWDKTKYCGHQLLNIATEFSSIQGGYVAHIEWLRQKRIQIYRNVKNKIVNHHSYQELQTQWSNLHEDRKLFLKLLFVVCVLLLLADCQNSTGLVQSVVLPIIHTVMVIICEIFSCFIFCFTRPVICALNCTVEVMIMFIDIFVNFVKTPIIILENLIWLPYTLLFGLANFIANTIVLLIRTLIPLMILLYIISPEIQTRCRQLLAQLQQS